MRIVELSPAYVWDCEECGRENFQRSVSSALDPKIPADAEIIRQIHRIGPSDPISPHCLAIVRTRPNRVTCRHCNTEFHAIDTGSTPDNDA